MITDGLTRRQRTWKCPQGHVHTGLVMAPYQASRRGLSQMVSRKARIRELINARRREGQ